MIFMGIICTKESISPLNNKINEKKSVPASELTLLSLAVIAERTNHSTIKCIGYHCCKIYHQLETVHMMTIR